ncbi:hypothetical protein [Agrobacterium radiobacter]
MRVCRRSSLGQEFGLSSTTISQICSAQARKEKFGSKR